MEQVLSAITRVDFAEGKSYGSVQATQESIQVVTKEAVEGFAFFTA